MQTLTLRRPDDWHLHLRDGAALAAVLPYSARVFARAIVMPNLQRAGHHGGAGRCLPHPHPGRAAAGNGLRAADDALPHRRHRPRRDRARTRQRVIHGVKLYPARATTLSDAGVRSLAECAAVFERMQALDLPLLVHGEVAQSDVDVFDRERRFLDEVLAPLQRDFPALRIVVEHVTTRDAVEYVRAAPGRVAATITAHHLLNSRNAMFLGTDGSAGMRPHFYCLPVLKREQHRQALLQAATSGDPRFFLGTDSAPHPRAGKESACGCAGCFTAPLALPMYAQAFEEAGALDRLEGFASAFGADFYGLPRNRTSVTLVRQAPPAPAPVRAQEQEFLPLPQDGLNWSIA